MFADVKGQSTQRACAKHVYFWYSDMEPQAVCMLVIKRQAQSAHESILACFGCSYSDIKIRVNILQSHRYFILV